MKSILYALVSSIFFLCIVPPAGALERELDSITRLRSEISLCNLLNGLYLSEVQMRGLKEMAEEVDRYYQAVRSEKERLRSELEESFTELRSVVLAGESIPDRVRKRAAVTNHQLKKKVEELKRKMGEEAARAERIFSESQKKIIADFKPCLIPPRNLANPPRAGQAENSDRFKKALTSLQNAPAYKFDRVFNRFYRRHVDKIDNHLDPFDEEEKARERERLYAIARRGREMSEVEFSLELDELAREAGEEGLAGAAERAGNTQLRKKIARTFFRPGSSLIYAQRLQLMKNME